MFEGEMEVNGRWLLQRQAALVCWHLSQSMISGHGVGVPQQGEGKVPTWHMRQTHLCH